MRQAELHAAMAAVGELATFLSHEIRNPLSALRLNLQMLRRDIQRGVVTDDEEELVDICLAEMQRLDDVVKTVLDLGRKGHTRIGVCDAHDTIEDTVRLMRSKFSAHGVVIETRLGAADSEVGIDGAKLKSVLINLLLNSIDAMASSSAKRITITSELHDLLDGTQFELRVTDTGPGVPPELETRIFEPFFTTKANGSGVGLATAQRIVKECGGVLRCNPAFENKIGGEFVMELPLAHPTQEVREPAMAAAG
jgi:two-component system C4-dicarboxylate transport sensor histidine kinase DctB